MDAFTIVFALVIGCMIALGGVFAVLIHDGIIMGEERNDRLINQAQLIDCEDFEQSFFVEAYYYKVQNLILKGNMEVFDILESKEKECGF